MCQQAPLKIKQYSSLWFLLAVLLFVNFYSVSTLTTKPAYWYDEAINVELARNFAEFGELDLIVAPDTFSGKGATVGSTGYPVTVPLAGFFKLFGFGLAQVRIYMLLWMSALILVFFFVARNLWGERVVYAATLFIVTFAPFYGNGRSVMGEIPGFLFFILSFYFFEQRKWWQSGVLLGLAVVSKPSVYVFLVPAFALVMLCQSEARKKRLRNLVVLGAGAVLSLVPWFAIYADEISRGGLGANILAHFKNPYAEAGASAFQNITHNLPTLFTSTTLLYVAALLIAVAVALYLERDLFSANRNLFFLALVYLPFALLQYLKSFGYLRYLIAAEFLVFVLFVISLPLLARWASTKVQLSEDSLSRITGAVIAGMVVIQTVHLLWFSDIYAGEKTQTTITYLSSAYPKGAIGVINVPQVASLIAPERKYQYLSTYGLWQFGVDPLSLPEVQLPLALIVDSEKGLSVSDKNALAAYYERDTGFLEGFTVYRKK